MHVKKAYERVVWNLIAIKVAFSSRKFAFSAVVGEMTLEDARSC